MCRVFTHFTHVVNGPLARGGAVCPFKLAKKPTYTCSHLACVSNVNVNYWDFLPVVTSIFCILLSCDLNT